MSIEFANAAKDITQFIGGVALIVVPVGSLLMLKWNHENQTRKNSLTPHP